MNFQRTIVVGATGMVGEVLLDLIARQPFTAQTIALASADSAGTQVRFGDATLTVERLDQFSFQPGDLAFFSAGGPVSQQYAPVAAGAGALVIDNTSAFRCREGIPLVVPEVNGACLDGIQPGTIIANPNCSTIQMVVALAPLHRAYRLSRINVATYQSISGAGRSAMRHLAEEIRRDAQGENDGEPPIGLAGNVVPHIDVMESNGFTREEMKMHHESRWILDDDELMVNATAVRVPVMVGHSEAVHAEFVQPFEMDDVRALLGAAPGVSLVDGDVATPRVHGSGSDLVYVARLRRDLSHPRGLDLWVVADNLRKGAALNAVQIAQHCMAGASGNAASAAVHSA